MADKNKAKHLSFFLMEECLKQEALLRRLLSRTNYENDEFVYSFLLGSRLFLSPNNLLQELRRIATEESTSEFHRNSADEFCLKCGQMQSKDIEVSSKASYSTGTDFRSQKFLSTAYITLGGSESNPTDGEDTIRRKRRGRRRISELENDSTSQTNASHPRDSRDSGILSAVLEPLLIESSNSVLGSSVLTKQTRPTCNDSGYALEESATNCRSCIASQQKVANAQSKQQLLFTLREWVQHFPADFRNKKTRWELDGVIRSCQFDNEDVSALCTEVVDCISRRTAAQESYEQQLNELDKTETLRRNIKFRKSKNWMLKFTLKLKNAADVNLVAQQLCLIEMNLLKHVGAEEFLQLFTEDGEEGTRTNLGACVRWFNRLSRLVATLVCICRKRKHARHVIIFYARVASRCFELSNFNSSMAILTGLSFGPVTRLKKTWNKLVLSELIHLQNAFDPSNNFLRYRTEYMNRVEELHTPTSVTEEKGANRFSIISQHSVGSAGSSHHGDSGIECDTESPSSGCQSPVPPFQASMKHFTFDHKASAHDGVMVPFLGLLVKDVYFLNHAIQTTNKDGNINFEKLRHLSNILRPIEEWKKMTSPYQKEDSVQEFLLQAPVQEDGDLYLLSYKRESPANRFEKQQLKTLKSKTEGKSVVLSSKIRCRTF